MDVFSTMLAQRRRFFVQHRGSANAQAGFILVTVLFFLLMLALMALSLLNATHLQLRMSQNYAMASQQFWAAESGLKAAEAQLSNRYASEYLQDSFDYAGYQVQYVIKRVGLPFCSNQRSIYYYRIRAEAKQAQRHALVLETTYAKKTHKKCDTNEVRLLSEGRSSWRELTNLN